jgi:hypothetical protein
MASHVFNFSVLKSCGKKDFCPLVAYLSGRVCSADRHGTHPGSVFLWIMDAVRWRINYEGKIKTAL